MSNFTTGYQKPKDSARQERLDAIRHFHRALIQQLDIPTGDFQIKTPFYDSRGREVVGIFPSEFKRDKGVFFEMVTMQNQPIDPMRRVYRIAPNSCFNEEYELTDRGSYLVPTEELRCIYPTEELFEQPTLVDKPDIRQDRKFSAKETTPSKTAATKTPVTTEDAPYSEMTIRDFYAIHTGKPVSTKSWLNDLIKSSN